MSRRKVKALWGLVFEIGLVYNAAFSKDIPLTIAFGILVIGIHLEMILDRLLGRYYE
jgi:hypothetical protein